MAIETKISEFLSKVRAKKAFLKLKERKQNREGSSGNHQEKKNQTWSCSGFPQLASAVANTWDICSCAQPMGREDKLQQHSTPGPVPALPFGTDDQALPSVHASGFWLKLPKGVRLEMKYSYCKCPPLEICGAAGQQHTQWYKPRLSISADTIQPGFRLPI